tara:strand:- start:1479 stop:2045 length:567 start_codon:yes stop_codon:yes gene_type:complete
MDVLKKDFKYKLVKNFFTKEEIELGKYYYLLSHKRNMNNFDYTQNNNQDSAFTHDSFSDTFLIKKLPLMEKETGLKLFPTYAYSRVYTHNSVLTPHKDRPSCEVSVTAMWGSCGTPWPIFMDGNPIDLQPGDAVIYLGMELSHWREYFKGDWHAQTFFHYVDQNGSYTRFKYDKRNLIQDPTIFTPNE